MCHFIEHGPILEELTKSQLVIKSMQLTRNCSVFGDVLNGRIMKQVSTFLRELSNDNEYIKGLNIEDFSPIVEDESVLPVNPENVDFYWNLLEFHFNVITEKEGQVGIYTRLSFYMSKIS